MRNALFALLSLAAFLSGCADYGKSYTIRNKSEGETETIQSEEHTFGLSWSYDENDHWRVCTCGHNEIKDKASHAFASWVIDVDPSETSEGKRHRSCSVCAYQQEETLAKMEHVHNWGEASYTWASDYRRCSAKHICSKNSLHEEEETVESSYEVLYEATSSSSGRGCYTAVFQNPSFFVQTHYVTLPKLHVPVTGVGLNKTTLEISMGNYAYLSASITPKNASNQNLIWSSSDENIAEVEEGKVRGKSEGKATITVTTEEGGYSASCEVTVNYIPVTGLALSKESLALEIGEESPTIYARLSPRNASIDEVAWSIDDSGIASFELSSSGVKVKGIALGETALTATSKDGGFTSSCLIQVIEKKNLSLDARGSAAHLPF